MSANDNLDFSDDGKSFDLDCDEQTGHAVQKQQTYSPFKRAATKNRVEEHVHYENYEAQMRG
jgi:hypothetical protein